MGAIDGGLVPQRFQGAHIAEHLLCRALEQPPAAHREQRVADKGGLVLGEVKGDMARRMRRDVEDISRHLAQPHNIAALHLHIQCRDAPCFGGGARDRAAGGLLYLGIAAGVVGMPVGVPDLRDLPAKLFRLVQHRGRDGGVDHHRLAADRFVDQPDIIVGQHRNADNRERHYQLPTLGMLTQGSAGAKWPSCRSSIEMPSGVRTKAIWPSRGGRLMVTPASINRWQVA